MCLFSRLFCLKKHYEENKRFISETKFNFFEVEFIFILDSRNFIIFNNRT